MNLCICAFFVWPILKPPKKNQYTEDTIRWEQFLTFVNLCIFCVRAKEITASSPLVIPPAPPNFFRARLPTVTYHTYGTLRTIGRSPNQIKRSFTTQNVRLFYCLRGRTETESFTHTTPTVVSPPTPTPLPYIDLLSRRDVS